ncbi:MAG: GerMN domain-containing protein [Spirulinaceae cyanobacterium]
MKRSTSFRQLFSLGLLLTVTLLGACSESAAPDTATAPAESPEAAAEPSPDVAAPPESESDAPPATQAPAQAPAQAPNAAPAKDPSRYDRPVQVYWLTDEDNAIELMSTPAAADKSTEPAAQLKSAMETLLAGPETQDDRSTTIPAETTLRELAIEPDGVHVDLSSEFTQGGGSLSMTARVAQILYTATSANPEGPMWLKVDGEPLEVLGGEGIILEQPLTRQYFEANFDL